MGYNDNYKPTYYAVKVYGIMPVPIKRPTTESIETQNGRITYG